METDGPATGEPPGDDRELVTGQGRQRGVKWMRETATDAGTRRRAQSQAAEDGGWWVGITFRWTTFCARRGG